MACLSLLSLPSWSNLREECWTLPPFQWFHSAFAPVLMFTTLCVFLHLRRRLSSTDVRSLGLLVGFPTRYRAERFSGRKPISRGSLHSVSGPNASRVLQNLSWTKYESLMHAGLNRVASSLFRLGRFLPYTNLSCSLSRGAHCFAVRVESRFIDDE